MPPAIFLGREREAEQLAQALVEEPEEPLVVYGPAGIGKTALAKLTARGWQTARPGTVLWVGIGNPTLPETEILRKLLRLLGRVYVDPELGARELLTQIQHQIAGNRTLVVLDDVQNLDQVTGITSLAEPAEIDLLVTLREEAAATQLSHRVLKLHPLEESESIRLVKHLVPALSLEPEEGLLEDLVHAVGGNPSHLALLAKHIRQVPGEEKARLRDLVESLESSQEGLQLGEARIPVAEPVRLAYQKLDPLAQTLFRLVGLVGSTSFEAGLIAHLLEEESKDVEAGLERLVALSLLNRTEEGLYQCPATFQAFASGLLERDPDGGEYYAAYHDACLDLALSLDPAAAPQDTTDYSLAHLRNALQQGLNRRDWARCRAYARLGYRWVTVQGEFNLVQGTDWFLGHFKEADFENSLVAECNLSAGDFRGTDLSGSGIVTVVLSGSDFRGADFSNARISFTDFRGGDLRGADFSGAILVNVELSGVDLRGADFTGALLHNVPLNDADAREVDFTAARFINVAFEGARLSGAYFQKAVGVNVDLTGAADFRGLEAEDSIWVNYVTGR
jgi:uncharacterized protein YjbI with pentapeptide repeats